LHGNVSKGSNTSSANADVNATLAEQASGFASRVQALLDATLPGTRTIGANLALGSNRVTVQPLDSALESTTVPLFVGGEHRANLVLSFLCSLDRSGTFLKTDASKFHLHLEPDRQPLARLEFQHDLTRTPRAHWQFHGERGSFTQLLVHAQYQGTRSVRDPARLSALHFPLGGQRFRPCLEDFIEFLISECGVDSIAGWEAAVHDGREIWRRFQTRAIARDLQVETAETLRELGWKVTPPAELPDEHRDALRHW
jgi:hypothetical protein